MAQIGTDPSSTTTAGGSGGGFPFNGMPGDTSVPGVPAPDDVGAGADDSSGEDRVDPREAAAEAEASRHGWKSREAWEAEGRNVERWRPASEFLEVRRGIAAVAQEENAGLRAKLASLEAKLAERERIEADARGKFTLDTLQLELKQARDNSDWDKVDEINEKLIEHKVERATAPKTPAMPAEMQQTLVAFRNENQAIFADQDLTVDFTVKLKAIIDAGAAPDLQTALKHAKRQVVRDNPEKFQRRINGDTRRSSMVETGGSSGNASGGRTWNDLKPEYRKIADNDIAKGRYTKEDYLANCDQSAFRR